MKRAALPLAERWLKQFPCVAIYGPRQCGKTTLITQFPSPWKRYDLEKSTDHETISRDPGLFLKLHPNHVAFDEAQILPSLFPALRVAIDDDRQKRGRFLITGSSSPHLVRAISESLAGRVAIIEMAPFSCSEALGYEPSAFFHSLTRKGKLSDFLKLKPRRTIAQIHDFWLRGGYPDPWLHPDPVFAAKWMEDYLQTYVHRDMARLFPGLDQNRFRRFIRMLSGLSGTIVNYSDVARNLGVSPPTAHDYVEIAHGSYLWRNLPAHNAKTIKRLIRHPKGYFRDSGLLHYLWRITDLDSLLAHPQVGNSWEGMVIEEILRGLQFEGMGFDASYYRTAAGAEIDLILEGTFGCVPIEVKYSQTVSPQKLRALTDFIKEHKCPYGLVINNDDAPYLYTEKILGLPFACL